MGNATEVPTGAKPRIAIIGAGVVGSTIGILLRQKGYPVTAVASKTREHATRLAQKAGAAVFDKPEDCAASGDIVFITTPDREIEKVARAIAQSRGFRAGQVVLHTSGFLASGILEPARGLGARVASMHPLQSFANVEAALATLPGSLAAIEGDDAAIALIEAVAIDLGLKPFVVPTASKPLYHAAAAVASNYLVSIIHFSVGLYERLGISREEAISGLLPLIEGTLENVRRLGPARALTGPIARGDIDVVRGHLEAISRAGVSAQPASPAQPGVPAQPAALAQAELTHTEVMLYAILGQYTVKVALERGSLSEETAAKLRDLFTEYIGPGDRD